MSLSKTVGQKMVSWGLKALVKLRILRNYEQTKVMISQEMFWKTNFDIGIESDVEPGISLPVRYATMNACPPEFIGQALCQSYVFY